jgi:5S rRNA maturation endonuclease (ribonuclease M5)
MGSKIYNDMKSNILTKDIIFSYTTAENIYLKFLNLTESPKGNISSPFSEDKNASFKLYKNGTFKCNSSGKQGDAFEFVANLKQLDCKVQFNKVLSVIAKEMNLAVSAQTDKKNVAMKNQIVAKQLQSSTIEEKPFVLNVVNTQMKEEHFAFWNNLGVQKELLEKYNIRAVEKYGFFSSAKNKDFNFTIKENVLAFSYEVNGNFEVYVPSQPDKKQPKIFSNGLQNGDIFGLEQLGGEKTENLIICAGKKDTIVAVSRGYKAITFRSETHNPTSAQIKALQSLCKNLFICYDNDKGGETGRNAITSKFQKIIPLQLPKNESTKGYDLTDYFQEYTPEDFQKIIDLAIKVKSDVVDLQENKELYTQYELPKEVKTPIAELIEDIEKYRMFMANNQIWIMQGDTKKHFKSVSNFVVKIIQHMQDEKLPMKLIKIRNVYKQEKIFDVLSDKLNTPQKFDDIVTSHGNYLWSGTPKDFHILKAFLFDKMGNGKKIDCLGWQKEDNFWLWNNKVNLCDGNKIEIDENGIFKHKETSYYVPSANKVYKENAFKYEPQKRVCIKASNVTIDTYLSKMFEVHRNNAISAILFTVASIFQDIVVDELKAFPILFLHGKASSGKDQLANCCQSFFGKPQSAINIEGGASTLKAHIREFAQFVNIICQFSEYKNGDKQLDGILKGIWDRNGYKRGTLDSHVSTETVPILSSLILTGNHSPDDEALITRLLWLDMSKNTFTEDEVKKYDELADMTEKGISSFTDDLLKERSRFLTDFKTKFRLYKTSISAKMPIGSPSRFSTNFAILGATYDIFKDTILFPFTAVQMMEHFVKISEFQMSKINSASASNKWWDCFLVCIRTNGDNKLDYERDIKLEGNFLYFNFSNTYNKIQRQWYNQYKEMILAKATMQDTVKKENAFVEIKSSYRFRTGRDGSVTSAFVVDITKLSNFEEINEAIHYMNTMP